MRKIILLVSSTLIILVSPVTLAPARAADWGVGLMSNVLWWQPSFRSEYENFEIDPLLLWGPVVSITFENKINVSLVFLQNVINPGSASFESNFNRSLGPGQITIDSKATRADLDFTASYPLSRLIRIFCGYKLFTLDFYPADLTITSGPYVFHDGGKTQNDAGGPQIWANSAALGTSMSFPLFDGTSLNFTSSLLYSYLITGINLFHEQSPGILEVEGNGFNYQGVGANITLGISYFIGTMSTVVSAGGRFQYITYDAMGDAPELADDYFYGIQISAMYLL
ncbi:MAG: hypothetical protein KBA61_09830 [Spirochaetes bacterium]|nr:hypothetical protein [Spirochaetota bacterium]